MIRFENYASWIWWGILLWLPVVITLLVVAWSKRRKLLRSLGNSELISSLSQSISPRRRVFKETLRILALASLLIALAGPKFSSELSEVSRKGVDIVIALDVSNSMLAQDVVPSRLEKAKFEIRRLISQLRGDRVALIVFAGQAHLQTPLTLDYAAFEMFLDIADEQLIGVQGTALEAAISEGLRSFNMEEEKYKTMILISDGEDHEGRLDEVLDRAIENNVVIHTAGIGTFSGTPIPILDDQGEVTGYRKTRNGEIVTTRLTTATLEQISQTTGGRFVHLAAASASLDPIYGAILSMDQKEFTRHEFTNFREQYAWFLGLAIILLLVELLVSDLQPRARTWDGRLIERRERS